MSTKQKRPPAKTDYGTVRLAADLVWMIRAVTAFEGNSATDIIDPLIRPTVQARYHKAVKQMAAEIDAK